MRYRIVIDGRIGPRLANSLEHVELEPRGDETDLLADVETATELDALLARLADLGLEVNRLSQEPDRA